ncbi:MAG TPA: DUF3419 family protein [Longimicrobiaceae bacterium]|nr:DUF3419 family protein [Longimicrobiaceae bacterium]
MSERSTGVRERVAWNALRYASVWEDADVLCDALRPVATDGRLLSISSAGDNVLALLTLDPAEVIAVDLNPAQLACLELRIAAFRDLDHEDLLGFLGVYDQVDRSRTYHQLRGSLSPEARTFWDAHSAAIEEGIIHAGRFERYLRTFRRRILPLVHSRRVIEALREARAMDQQRSFYEETWNTARWRFVFRLFFSRIVMGRLGRDPAFFDHVEGSVGDRILERTRHALVDLPVRTNPYLAYIMTGNFVPEALPSYLRPENRALISDRLDRIRLVRGSVDETGGYFDGFNLSDIFEYMDPVEHASVYEALLNRARPLARLVYWNLVAPRACPPELASRVRPLHETARELHARDQAWFYGELHIDEVLAE